MREQSEIVPSAEPERPGPVTAALSIGWTYQALAFGVFFLFYIPSKQAYLDSFKAGRKVERLSSQEEINMILNPNATMVGEVAGFLVGFAVTVFLLKQAGFGHAWARVALTVWFLFRMGLCLASPLGGWLLFDIVPQLAVIVLLFLPSSRRWFN